MKNLIITLVIFISATTICSGQTKIIDQPDLEHGKHAKSASSTKTNGTWQSFDKKVIILINNDTAFIKKGKLNFSIDVLRAKILKFKYFEDDITSKFKNFVNFYFSDVNVYKASEKDPVNGNEVILELFFKK
jgi:hypothetical protein